MILHRAQNQEWMADKLSPSGTLCWTVTVNSIHRKTKKYLETLNTRGELILKRLKTLAVESHFTLVSSKSAVFVLIILASQVSPIQFKKSSVEHICTTLNFLTELQYYRFNMNLSIAWADCYSTLFSHTVSSERYMYIKYLADKE